MASTVKIDKFIIFILVVWPFYELAETRSREVPVVAIIALQMFQIPQHFWY
jgi:hypothetical protein